MMVLKRQNIFSLFLFFLTVYTVVWKLFANIFIFKLVSAACGLFSFFLVLLTWHFQYKNDYIANDLRCKKNIYFLLFWSVLVIFRVTDCNWTSIIGNPYFSLAWLTPVVVCFSKESFSLRIFKNFLILLLKSSLLLSIIAFIFHLNELLDITYTLSRLSIPTFLFYPYLNKKNKLLILASFILFIYLSYFLLNRTGLLECAFITLILAYYFYLNKPKSIKILLFFLVFIFSFFMYSKFKSLTSADNDMTVDTRTFLYTEIIGDFHAKDFVFGRGIEGKYYSPYFEGLEITGFEQNQDFGGDSSSRIMIEVGVLQMLLKGGFLMILLSFIIFFSAFYYGFFNSRNIFIKLSALYVLSFLLIMFIEHVPEYSFNYLFVWIIIGFCLNKRFLYANDKELNILL